MSGRGLVLLALLAGCAPATFDGVVSGQSLAVADAYALPAVGRFATQGEASVAITLGDHPSLCEDQWHAYSDPANGAVVHLGLEQKGVETLAPGTFDVVTGASAQQRAARAHFQKFDETCRGGLFIEAKSGTVTLTEVSPEGFFEGTFEVRFGDAGDRGSGSFRARPCEMSEHAIGMSLGKMLPSCH